MIDKAMTDNILSGKQIKDAIVEFIAYHPYDEVKVTLAGFPEDVANEIVEMVERANNKLKLLKPFSAEKVDRQ